MLCAKLVRVCSTCVHVCACCCDVAMWLCARARLAHENYLLIFMLCSQMVVLRLEWRFVCPFLHITLSIGNLAGAVSVHSLLRGGRWYVVSFWSLNCCGSGYGYGCCDCWCVTVFKAQVPFGCCCCCGCGSWERIAAVVAAHFTLTDTTELFFTFLSLCCL